MGRGRFSGNASHDRYIPTPQALRENSVIQKKSTIQNAEDAAFGILRVPNHHRTNDDHQVR